LEVTAPSLTAEAVQKGKSLFANKMGQDIAASELNIIDDGHKKGAIISSPFDGEGVSTQKTILVENGILKSYLHNTYTAKKDGVSSTGNAKRGSYKSTPEVGTTNFYIDKGNITKDELIKNVEKGFYITEVMGMHTANPISGDFSVGASGIWIENGEFTKPVRGVAIAGNIKELLKSVEAVADDLTFFIGIGSPTLRIAKMTVSGS
jgi:PmbA protein